MEGFIHLSRLEIINELAISSSMAIISWFAAFHKYSLIALAAPSCFSLLDYDKFHNCLSLCARTLSPITEWVMFIMSILMLGSSMLYN